MHFLTDLGIGIAIGMLAGTTGTHGSARGRMTLLAAVIGLIAGFLLDGPPGAILALLGAVTACIVISDLLAGAGRRGGGGGGALGFLVAVAALIVAVASVLLAVSVIVIALVLVWLGIARHRRAKRKHAGLRVLR